MAQTWHSRREQQAGNAQVDYWRATNYQLNDLADPPVLEATANAAWERFVPFDSYRPSSKVRDVKAGPHLTFLRLKGILEEQPDIFPKALVLFAKEYGFLGAFEEDYPPHPIFPEAKMLVAPEAVIDDRGRLRRVDPATEGKELLLDLLEPRGWFSRFTRKASYNAIALPSEIMFNPKEPGLNSERWPVFPPRQHVRWEDVRDDFGALWVLDEETFKGASVLCTREPLRRWETNLRFFPTGDTPVEDLVSGDGVSLNSYLQDISPRVLVREDGGLERGWHCRNLLQAMYVMLFLDLTGGSTIKQCQSRGCPNYFRVGPQSKSKYCSNRCANRASTRLGRGQEP